MAKLQFGGQGKQDRLDHAKLIQEQYVYWYIQAIDFFEKNNLSKTADELKTTNQNLLGVLLCNSCIQTLKPQQAKHSRSFGFQIPTSLECEDKNPSALVTWAFANGILTKDFTLTPLARRVKNQQLSIPSYCLCIASKQGVYMTTDDNKEIRVTNVLSLVCAALCRLNRPCTPEELWSECNKVFSCEDIELDQVNSHLTELLISRLLSFDAQGKIVVNEEDWPLVKYIAEQGSAISANIDDSYMGRIDNGIVEIITKESKSLFEYKYKDLVDAVFTPEGYKRIFAPQRNSLQVIYYGAPGTGKSYRVKDVQNEYVYSVDHASGDSWESELLSFISSQGLNTNTAKGYMSFLKAETTSNIYSQIIKKPCIRIIDCYDEDDVLSLYDAYKAKGVLSGFNVNSLPSSAIGKYYEFLVRYNKEHVQSAVKRNNIVIRTTFHPDSDYASFVGSYKPVTEVVPSDGCTHEKKEINYDFVPQPFIQAYCKAWEVQDKGENVYLVVEEINRGNCAQIFGDLFQLLDRCENGFSAYAIVPDKDISKFIFSSEEYGLKGINIPDVLDDNDNIVATAEEIRTGQKLVLPNNLHIWATMNTSDQSLFPIDSAFKRRWDWKYVPIKNADKGWVIVVNQEKLDWWEFLEAINDQIYNLTDSEDKQMGYFFVKAKNGTIDANLFANKVLFYLWNDVMKDFGNGFTIDKETKKFTDFFLPQGDVNEELLFKYIDWVIRSYKEQKTKNSDTKE